MLNEKDAEYVSDGPDYFKFELINNSFLYKSNEFYDPLVLYNYFFKSTPSIYAYKHQLKTDDLVIWFKSEFKKIILKFVSCNDYVYDSSKASSKINFIEYFFVLPNDILVFISWNHLKVLYNPETLSSENEAKVIFDKAEKQIKKLKKKVKVNIYLLMNLQFGLELKELPLKKRCFNITTNYNDDLPHDDILVKLNANESGMFLFYGQPGTGKSSYIEYVINQLNKTVIFLSPKNASALDDPNFTEILVNNPNAIIIVEDAELLLKSRDHDINANGISTLLSITDGLLGSLGIQVIATFNTQLAMIDKALLRKGRCKVIYEFKPLSINKTNVLLHQLGFITSPQDKSLCLSDIYYYNENDPENISKTTIGFSK